MITVNAVGLPPLTYDHPQKYWNEWNDKGKLPASDSNQSLPIKEEKRLEDELKKAIESEDFERAADLRDKLKAIKEEDLVSEKGDLVGIISVSDIMNLSEVVRERRSTSVSAASEGTDWSWDATTVLYITTNELQLPDKLVSEVMVSGIVTTFEQATVGEVTKTMRRHDVDQLPVTNAKGELCGIIRDKDLMRILLEPK